MRGVRLDERGLFVMPATWGPFMPGIPADERRAQLRGLQVATKLLCGPRAAPVVALLRAAETDTSALQAASAEIDRLPSKDRRRVLSTFLGTM